MICLEYIEYKIPIKKNRRYSVSSVDNGDKKLLNY